MTPPASTSGFPLARVILLTLVAALLATVLWFGADILALRAKVATLESERDLAITTSDLSQGLLKERTLLAEGMINDLRRQLREQPGFAHQVLLVLAPSDGNAPARGAVLWDPQQKAGLLATAQLPALPDDQVYRASIVPPDSTEPLSIGTLQPDSAGKATISFRLGSPIAGTPEFTVGVVARNAAMAVRPRTVLSSK